jgi:hypothetical protein
MVGPSIKIVGWNRRNKTEMLHVAGGRALERNGVVSRRDVPSLDELARMRPCQLFTGARCSATARCASLEIARPGGCPAPAPLPRMPLSGQPLEQFGGSVWCLSAHSLQLVDEFSGPKRIFRSFLRVTFSTL